MSVNLIYCLPLQAVASFDATVNKIITCRYANLHELFKPQRLIRPEDKLRQRARSSY